MIVSHKQTMLMAPLNSTGNESPVSSRKRRGVMRMIKNNLRVDMTPMVDLGFLLITFFVITTELAKPTAMNLYMPKDGGPPTELGASNALTVLLDKDKIYYYNGEWKDAIKTGGIIETNLSGTADLRKVIGEKQLLLDVTQKNKEGRDGLMLLIKPGNEVSYKNVVDVLDETTISMVKKYAIVKQSVDEKAWLKEK
jgi:biopolymer transport protein ExbD